MLRICLNYIEVGLGKMIGKYSMVFYGFFGQVLHGRIYLEDIHHTRPAIDDSKAGYVEAYSKKFFEP